MEKIYLVQFEEYSDAFVAFEEYGNAFEFAAAYIKSMPEVGNRAPGAMVRSAFLLDAAPAAEAEGDAYDLFESELREGGWID